MNKINNFYNNFICKIINQDIISGKCKLVHTRFPPEPNGYLHIGHAKSIYINFKIAEYYKGKCNLRFDDTNPLKEHNKYINSIKKDIIWLGFKWNNKIHYSSEYFEQLYKYAIELINKGIAYVDQLSLEEIRKYRGTLTTPGKNSPYRNRSIKENLSLFLKMRNGELNEGTACLRAKINMSSPLILMRDPVLYRIKHINHHQTGNKWCIYPMYDFAHCISDSIEGITHSLCTMEFQDNRKLYNWIINNITIKNHPKQYEFSRLNLEYTITSKRKLNKLITLGIVTGWNDPRMPTISGLRRKGYTPNAIIEFCNRIGVTKQNNNITIETLEACIRQDLNKNAPRVMAVIKPLLVIIENMSKEYLKYIDVLNHPNKPEMGIHQIILNREIYIDQSDFNEQDDVKYYGLTLKQKVKLRYAFIIKTNRVEKNEKGDIIKVFVNYDLDTLDKKCKINQKIKGIIHWVSAINNISAEFRLYNKLFTIPKPELVKDFINVINPYSIITYYGFIESSISILKTQYKQFQFEREGYFCIDNHKCNLSRLIFHRTVKLKDNQNKFKKFK